MKKAKDTWASAVRKRQDDGKELRPPDLHQAAVTVWPAARSQSFVLLMPRRGGWCNSTVKGVATRAATRSRHNKVWPAARTPSSASEMVKSTQQDVRSPDLQHDTIIGCGRQQTRVLRAACPGGNDQCPRQEVRPPDQHETVLQLCRQHEARILPPACPGGMVRM